MVKLAVISAVLAAVTSPSAAQMSSTQLYEFCTSYSGTPEYLSCASFIGRVLSGLGVGQATGAAQGLTFCPPANITAGQAMLVVEKYMRDHPEQLNQHPGTLSSVALLAAFPCKKSN